MREWIELVNSDWHGHLGHGPDQDRLDDPQWLAKFLADSGLPRVDPRAETVQGALKKLRGLLKRIVDSCLAGKPVSDADLATLNRYLANELVYPQVRRQNRSMRMELTTSGKGLEAVLFSLTAAVADFLVQEDVGRLRACSNPNCRWIFFDATRSRTARWCGGTCRSLIKVRAHRQHRKTELRSERANKRKKSRKRL